MSQSPPPLVWEAEVLAGEEPAPCCSPSCQEVTQGRSVKKTQARRVEQALV